MESPCNLNQNASSWRTSFVRFEKEPATMKCYESPLVYARQTRHQ